MNECKMLMDQGRKMRASWLAQRRSDHPKGYRKYREEIREKHGKNRFKLNKEEINEIAARKKSSPPGSDNSDSEQQRSEASSSSESSASEDLYNFENLRIRSKSD
jgi:hypothetical protein